MSKQSTELDQLIQRYLEGKCSAEEKVQLDLWIESLQVSSETSTEEDVKHLRSRIDAIIQPDEVKVKKVGWSLLHVAASILCFGLASFFYLSNQQNSTVQPRTTTAEVTIPTNVDRLRVYYNHRNVDRTVQLADGTKVTLTPNSSMHFLEDFETDYRHVSLRGKARFDVAKDASRPFSVITGDIHTTAIGTVFWVTHLDKQTLPSVQLLSGKVAITQKGTTGNRKLLAALEPGDVWDQKGIHLQGNALENPTEITTKAPLELQERVILAFHHTPLKEVFDTLSAHFQTDITYEEGKLTGMTFYGNYTAQVVLNDILKHIMLTHDLLIKYHEETATYEVSLQSNHQTND